MSIKISPYIYPGLMAEMSKFSVEIAIAKTIEYYKKDIALSIENRRNRREISETEYNVFKDNPSKLIKSKRRFREIVKIKSHLVYLILEIDRNITLTELGGKLGGRDHSSIIHLRNLVEESLKLDKKYKSRGSEATFDYKDYKKYVLQSIFKTA